MFLRRSLLTLLLLWDTLSLFLLFIESNIAKVEDFSVQADFIDLKVRKPNEQVSNLYIASQLGDYLTGLSCRQPMKRQEESHAA